MRRLLLTLATAMSLTLALTSCVLTTELANRSEDTEGDTDRAPRASAEEGAGADAEAPSSDAGTDPERSDGDAEDTDAQRGQAPTPAEITEFVANTEWSFSRSGIEVPFSVTLVDGRGQDEAGRTYTLGEPVASDANADGIPDIAIPIAEVDGNGFHELWYIWLGADDASAAIAEQVSYPIGVTNRCGHTVNAVTPASSGFTVDETLKSLSDQRQLDCSTPGTWHQIREISVTDADDAWYPIQVAPSVAWGGICPPPLWEDTDIVESGWELLAVPAASAPKSTNADEEIAIYAVAETHRFEAEGFSIAGYRGNSTGSLEESDTTPVLNCAFAATDQ